LPWARLRNAADPRRASSGRPLSAGVRAMTDFLASEFTAIAAQSSG
jgi:hypothetical protein